MKLHLGDSNDHAAAVAVPILMGATLWFGVTILRPFEVLSFVIAFWSFTASLLCFLLAWKFRFLWFEWGCFDQCGIRVTVPVCDHFFLPYSQLKYCGIEYYAVRAYLLYAWIDSRLLYLSTEPLPKMKTTGDQVKMRTMVSEKKMIMIGFYQKLYQKICEMLPEYQVRLLQNDYERLFSEKPKWLRKKEKHRGKTR